MKRVLFSCVLGFSSVWTGGEKVTMYCPALYLSNFVAQFMPESRMEKVRDEIRDIVKNFEEFCKNSTAGSFTTFGLCA